MNKTIISGVIFGLVVANGLALAAPHKKLKGIHVAKNDVVRKAVKPSKLTVAAPAKSNRILVAQAKPISPTAAAPSAVVPSAEASKPATSDQSPLDRSSKGVTAMPITTAVAATKKSPFSIKYRSYNAANLVWVSNSSESPDREVAVWDRLNLTYNFNPNVSFSIMPQLYHTWFGNRDRIQDDSFSNLSQPYAAYLGNTALILADSKIATLQGGIIWDGIVRYDAPTSEFSQKAGSLGETRLGTGLSKSIGKVDVKASLTYRYFIQQYTTSEAELTNPRTPSWGAQNDEWWLYSLLDLGYNISKRVTISLETGFINKARLADDTPRHQRDAVRVDEVVMNPEISVAVNDNFSLALGLWEEPDMKKLKTPVYEPLNPVNGGEAYLMTTIQF